MRTKIYLHHVNAKFFYYHSNDPDTNKKRLERTLHKMIKHVLGYSRLTKINYIVYNETIIYGQRAMNGNISLQGQIPLSKVHY